MSTTLGVLALTLICLAGLVLTAIGLPGLWVMVAAVVGYGFLTDFSSIGIITIVSVTLLAAIGEVLEAWLGFGLTRRYGGSKRAAWGSLLGGLAGAMVGVPIPLIGSVIGALIGSFIGAVVFEYTTSATGGQAVRAGMGALLGRAAATAAKIACGVIMTVIALFAALT